MVPHLPPSILIWAIPSQHILRSTRIYPNQNVPSSTARLTRWKQAFERRSTILLVQLNGTVLSCYCCRCRRSHVERGCSGYLCRSSPSILISSISLIASFMATQEHVLTEIVSSSTCMWRLRSKHSKACEDPS